MLTVIVRFALPDGQSLGGALDDIRAMVPMYQAQDALVHKQISLEPKRQRGTSVYLWNDRTAAERFFTIARAKLKEQTGAEPDIEMLETQVFVNNTTGESRFDD